MSDRTIYHTIRLHPSLYRGGAGTKHGAEPDGLRIELGGQHGPEHTVL